MFKKTLTAFAFSTAMFISTIASAQYTMIVPQEPGGGTSVWATLVAKQLEKFLGEPITLQHIPGAKDIAGFNKFHNELRFDDKTIMVSHGGNGESYLVDEVDYDYYAYEPIGMMNLTIVTGKRVEADLTQGIKFGSSSGTNPDVMAMVLMLGGPDLSMVEAEQIFKEYITYVPGLKGGERRLAYQRGELNATRETTAAYTKHFKDDPNSEVWFSHGVLNLDTGNVEADKNFPGQSFTEVFTAKWGVAPAGEFYNAYLLLRNFRDVLQKALWVNEGNPNADKIRAALAAMAADPEAVAAIEADTGSYDWVIGEEVNAALDLLRNQITEQTLRNLVEWNTNVIGQPAQFKTDLLK